MENAQHIVMRGKHDDYIFAKNNTEFLKTYDTDNKQIDYYTNLAMRVFDEFKIDGDYTFEGVRTNVQTWYNNKQKQIALLRNHPYWSEEAKAIIFLQTETRSVDINRAGHILGDMFNFVANNAGEKPKTELLGAIQNVMFHMGNGEPPLVTKDFINSITDRLTIDSIPKQVRSCLSCGCRITKLVRKAFEFLELSSGKIFNATTLKVGDDSFDKIYARFSDCLSELTVEKITLLSVHFNDFMLMSNGNSWSSCHFINSNNIFHEHTGQSVRGEYKQGCLSYALDAPSMILYTLPATYDGSEYYRCPKLTRMCCQYENGVLITGKCYPNNEDNLITRYRNILQQVLSQCGRFPNLWTFSKNTEKIEMFAKTQSGSAHYPDYSYSRQKPTVSMCRNVTFDLDNPMIIGSKAHCLFCSTEIDANRRSWLQCKKHERKIVCKICGKRTELHEIYDDFYCDDCTFWCAYHKRYEPKNVKTTDLHGDLMCLDAVLEKENTVHYDDIGLTVSKSNNYMVGDYVLMVDDVGCCDYGTGVHMCCYYPRRIVKITRKRDTAYNVSVLRNEREDYGWTWSANCFVGIVHGATDAHIGKTINEIREESTHETR